MIPKKNRFTRREFSLLRPRMKKFNAGDFLFFYCGLKNHHKLAAVIGKKVDKRAVARNAWRRSVYNTVGPELLKSQTPIGLVCLYKGDTIPENTSALIKAWLDFKQYAERKHLLNFNS